ncbi:MAG: dihydrofolate synthase/folylpolyglutamate synthase, partial [Bermanella sp.]
MIASRLSDWLQKLEQLHPVPIALGLDRIGQVYARMALDFSNTRVITVAGTNGKGSVVTLLQNLLLSAGYRVGAYTSPHLQRYTERVRVNAQEISDELMVASFEIVEQHRAAVSLTYFEFGTLAALQHFAGQSLDYLILEVGLGGRLDAVNIIDPQLTIVTSIDLDHQDWLGNDREAIGLEKAGIFRQGVPVVCGDAKPPESLQQHAREHNSPLYLYGREFSLERRADKALHWRGQSLDGQPLELHSDQTTTLLDSNIATALQALALLPELGSVDYAALGSGVPGRQEL